MKTAEERGEVESVDAYALQLPDLYGEHLAPGMMARLRRPALRRMRDLADEALARGRVEGSVGRREARTIRKMIEAAGPDGEIIAVISNPWPVGPDRSKTKAKRRTVREARKRNRPKKRRR